MVSHKYKFGDILRWLIHGLTQWVREIAPLIEPAPEPRAKPTWWYDYYSRGDYSRYRDANGVPDATFIQMWLEACYLMLRQWIEEIGDWAVDWAVARVKFYTGLPSFGFATFQAWITVMRARLGTFVPYFATDIAKAAERLYLWVPAPIRHGLQRWDDYITSFASGVEQWVLDLIGDAKAKGLEALAWVSERGIDIYRWYQRSGDTLDWIRRDPVKWVSSKLGPEWPKLQLFGADCAQFYYNLWGTYGKKLSTFLADPGGYIFDRLADKLAELW